MAKRYKDIKIVVHTPTDAKDIFSCSQIGEFWMEKIIDKIQDCSCAGIDTDTLIDGLRINKIAE